MAKISEKCAHDSCACLVPEERQVRRVLQRALSGREGPGGAQVRVRAPGLRCEHGGREGGRCMYSVRQFARAGQ